MVKTSAACPKCKQPITIEITRLFDTNTDPQAKEKLLSGQANLVQCPVCGYQGPYPTPIVYHDPDKELLLTFFPPELGVPVNQQEQTIGPLIKKTVDNLAPEKRKAYLFQPQTMLTQQRLFERILEADGITPEMMKAQQDRLSLIQRLAMSSPEAMPITIQQEDTLIDEQLFMILTQLIEASAGAGDERSAKALEGLQKQLLEHSTFGKKLAEQSAQTQDAIKELQELSKKGLTRESLLELVIQASDLEIKLMTIVSMTRGALDYGFFQLLSEKIDRAKGDEQSKLVGLRTRLLEMTQEIDEVVKAQTEEAHALLEEILNAEKVDEAASKALPKISQIFVDLLRHELSEAKKANNQPRFEKLQIVVQTIQEASASGAYIQLIEAMIQAPDENAINQILDQAGEAINEDFMQLLNGLVTQMEQEGKQPELVNKLKDLYRLTLRHSMKRNLKKNE